MHRTPRLAALVPLFTTLALVAIGALAAPRPARAQGEFGWNKVTYDRRSWHTLTTQHCEVFFYPEEEGLARQMAAIAESTCAQYDTLFRMTPRHKIPILSYSSHQAFQQSNATPGFIDEGTGGLTELIRGRVLIPHTGSTARLVWVTRHELTHAYMLEKLAQVQHANHHYHVPYPPLWFTEGLAEFVATTWDSQAEGLMQDAVVSGVAVRMTQSYAIEGTVLMYKEGQAFLYDVAAHEGGKSAVLRLFDHWTEADTFEGIWKKTFGRSLEDMDREWFERMRAHYYPAVADRRPVREVARAITKGHDSFNLAPCVLPQAPGDSTLRIAYLRAEDGSVDLRMRTEVHGRLKTDERLLRSGTTTKFESFHFFQSRLAASKDGRLAMVAQQGGHDVLHIYDLRARKLDATWHFATVVGLSSPTWLAGDSAVVLVGQAVTGRTDLYRVHVKDGALTPLTHDASDEEDPTAHPTRQEIAFASDREGGPAGTYHLFTLDLTTGDITQLTSGDKNDRHPEWSPDGDELAFLSDRMGIDDLWLWKAGRVQRASRFLGPSYDPAWRPDGKAMLFAGQSGWEFHLYEVPLSPVDSLWTAEPADSAREGAAPVAQAAEESRNYHKHMGLDIAQSVVGLDPALGAAGGGGLIALSDVLGDQGYSIFLSNDASTLSDFLDGMELGVTYFNRSQRLNYGVGAFRLTQEYDPDFDVIRRERRVGGSLLASYPLSKFTRLEASTVLRYAQDHLLRNGDVLNLWLLSTFLSYAHDDARYTYVGPAGGKRFNLTAGYTRDLSTGTGDSYTVEFDGRKYVTLAPDVVWASRLVTETVFGDDEQKFYLGGPFSVRGWDRRTISGTKAAFVQTEVRMPILRRLRLGVPAPIEFPQVSVALLGDAAVAGGRDEPLERIGAVGMGFYVGGGYFPVLRVDVVRRTDLVKFLGRNVTRFMLGFNF
jgi:hypothetical protein